MYPYVNIDYVWIYVWTALEHQVCYRKYLLGLFRSCWNRNLRGCHCELLSHCMIITIRVLQKKMESTQSPIAISFICYSKYPDKFVYRNVDNWYDRFPSGVKTLHMSLKGCTSAFYWCVASKFLEMHLKCKSSIYVLVDLFAIYALCFEVLRRPNNQS